MTDCYKLIKETISEIPAESDFLTVFQDLLCLKDVTVKSAFCRKMECVSHENGCDPVSRHTKRFKIEIEVLIDKIDKSKQDDQRAAVELRQGSEETPSAKQEFGAKFIEIIEKREAMITEGRKSDNHLPLPSGTYFSGSPISLTPLSAQPHSLFLHESSSEMSRPAPPPPPPVGGFSSNQPPSKVLHPKNKCVLKTPALWKKISRQDMSEKAFWVAHQEKIASEGIFEILSAKFSSKPQAKKENKVEHKLKSRKVKELKILDSKAARNLSILLSPVKKMSAQDMRRYILQIDEEKLTEAILQQLIKTMPERDQLKSLERFTDQFDELNEAEQFFLTIGSIKELVPRLKSISFKTRFHELVQDIKPDIVAATAACEEVKQSKKFCLILQMILLVGNYMNAGSRNEQAVGFEINFLTKLNFTKAVDHKTTLLHCIVEIIEKKHPDALSFAEELKHFDRAAMVSSEQIKKNLSQMKRSVKELETDLKNFSPHNEEDRFGDVMTGFLKEAAEQYEILENMLKKMEKLYEDLSVYYAFDPKKYTSDEFFTDIKSFKDMFQEAYKDNLRARELEEKMQRAREAKEKAQKEKQERLAKKKELIDISSGADQEGVMDSLLEALKTGQAFSHKPRRKPPARGAAERRAQLNRSRSRSNILAQHNGGRENVHMDSRNGEVAR